MLISRTKKFIFIHIYKNAGTSIRRTLHPYAYGRFQQAGNVLLKRIGIHALNPTPYHTHITARDAAHCLGPEKFNSYFSFAFVRNPWDWHASLYTFMLKDTTHYLHSFVKDLEGFDEYVEWVCNREKITLQSDFIMSDNGEKLVDYVGRFENLQEDFQVVCSTLGIEADLPKLNSSQSSQYKTLYKKNSIDLISETYKKDIDFFEYEF